MREGGCGVREQCMVCWCEGGRLWYDGADGGVLVCLLGSSSYAFLIVVVNAYLACSTNSYSYIA